MKRIRKWLWTPTKVFGLDRSSLILGFALFLMGVHIIGLMAGVPRPYRDIPVIAVFVICATLATLLTLHNE